MMREEPVSRKYVPELDGIRGLAFLAVFLFHASVPLRSHLTAGWGKAVLDLLSAGWAGVDLFFVLSGFLITSILLRTMGQTGYFRSFYARRTLRIFPPYYLMLAMLGVGFWLAPDLRQRFPDLYAGQGWYWIYLQNWVQAYRMSGQFQPAFLGHFWSLAIEEQFYLVWPLLVWTLGRRALLPACLALFVLPLLLRIALTGLVGTEAAQQWLYFATPTRLDGLVAGAAAAAWLDRGGSPASLRRFAVAVGWPALASFVFFEFSGPRDFWGNWPMATVGLSCLSLASLSLVLYGLGGSAVLRARPLRLVGRYSYGLYLFHWPVIVATAAALELAHLEPAPFLFLFAGLASATSFALAYLSWRMVESRLLALKDRLAFARV